MNDPRDHPVERFRYIEIGDTPQPPPTPQAPPPAQAAPPPPQPQAAQPEAPPAAEISVPEFRPFSEQQARTVLTTWLRATLPRRLLGRHRWVQRAPITRVANQVAYRVRLLTQYQARSLRYQEDRLGPEPIVSTHTVADLWSYSLPRPSDFVNRTASHPLRGTDQLVDCSQCHGLGLVRCPRCIGRGSITDLLLEGGGITPCPACRGTGSATCEVCRGQGQMRRYAVLVARYSYRDSSLIVSASKVPDDLLRPVRARPFVTLRQQRQLRPPPLNEPLDEAVRLLQQGAASAAGQALLFQQLEAEAFPVAEVSVEVRTGKSLDFFVYGEERRSYFPAPWPRAVISWARVAALAVLGLALVGGAVYRWLAALP